MKKTFIFALVLGAVIVVMDIALLYKQNNRFDNIGSRLDGIEMQLAGVRSSMDKQKSIQVDAEVKEKEVFTPTELAEYLNIKLDQVYDMIDAPDTELPYVCIDGEYRFGKDAIDEWMAGKRVHNSNDR